MHVTPNFCATLPAAAFAQAKPLLEKSGVRPVSPLAQVKPARCQPMVPLRSATTLLGTPALISDCAPMMLRVRPAQLTTISVSGDGTMSRARSTNSAPGTLMPVGIEMREYSSNGRLSSTLMSAPLRIRASSSCALTLGVPLSCSTNSPKALLGTCTPEKVTKPACSQAAHAAVEIRQVAIAGARRGSRPRARRGHRCRR